MKELALVGYGLGNPGLLTQAACVALREADLVIGAKRLIEGLPEDCKATRMVAVRDSDVTGILTQHKTWHKACVVLSGDIGLFSGAKKLYDALDEYVINTIPGISSVQYFAAKLHRPWQDWTCISAHGITCDLASVASRGGEVFLVTGGSNTVGVLCSSLCEAGLNDAYVAVGERLSYPDERVVEGKASDFAGGNFDDLSVMLVCAKPKESIWPWSNTGVPDAFFKRGKVPMTKQEIRSVALAKLRVKSTDVIYDIGAGTGSIAIELALLAKEGSVYAIEHNPEALSLIKQNLTSFGLSNLRVVEGRAPKALKDLPIPDAVFIGGSGGELPEILNQVRQVNPGVRVCVACVTVETLSLAQSLLSTKDYMDFEACQVMASRAEEIGSYHLMKAQNPIFLLSAQGVK